MISSSVIQKEFIMSKLCSIVLFCVLVTPMIKVPGFIGVRLEDFVVFTVVFYGLLVQNISFKLPVRVLLLIVFIPFLLVSITVGSFLLMPATLMDLTKYIWLFKSIVVYLLFYNYLYSSKDNVNSRIEYLLKLFMYFSVISSFICFQQYFNLLNLNKFYIPLIAPSQTTTLLNDYATPRVVGMLGNPNSQGYAFAIALVCSLYLFLKKAVDRKIILLCASFIFVGLVMTLSRSGLICFVSGCLFLFLTYKKGWSFLLFKLFFLAVLFSGLIMLFVLLKENETLYNLIIFRFEALSNISEDNSFVTRFHGWAINYEYFKISPFFGVGPLPRSVDIFGTADNEWLLFLRSYGLVGFFWLILFMLLPLSLKSSKSLEVLNRKRFVLACIFSTWLFMIPAGVITSSGLFSVFLCVLAVYDVDFKKIQLGKNSRKVNNI
jgi:hypothetical protein